MLSNLKKEFSSKLIIFRQIIYKKVEIQTKKSFNEQISIDIIKYKL